jgi:hypothetical protein
LASYLIAYDKYLYTFSLKTSESKLQSSCCGTKYLF